MNMELSTTTRGKAKLLWNGYAYTKHIEKNGMIRWRCACRASKHCPASVYTNLLPANPVLKKDHNHCTAAASNDQPVRIYLLPKCLLPKYPITKTSYYQNVWLPKCPVTKISVTKTSITKVSFTEMSVHFASQSWAKTNNFPTCRLP